MEKHEKKKKKKKEVSLEGAPLTWGMRNALLYVH